MSVYAPVPHYAARKSHPRTLLLIVGAHAALLAAVMSAKMDLPVPFDPTVTKVKLLPEDRPPPENPPPQPGQQPRETVIDRVPAIVPLPQPVPPLEAVPLPNPLPGPGPLAGPGSRADPGPRVAPVRTGPRFVTPDSLLKPPYPQSKLRLEEEAVLRLRLSIDARGRVTAVEPVGRADPVFVAAARRHLLAHWRYRPATEDGRAVASSTVITLRFQLED